MSDRYRATFFVLFLILTLGSSALAAQYDAPGIGSLVQGQAKVVAVIGAGASGAPAGFTVEWMKLSDWQANGSQWPTAPDPMRVDANFTGVPTLNTWNGELGSFTLDAWAAAAVEIGDLFDETGVEATSDAELDMGTRYILRVFANGDAENERSPYSNDLIVDTTVNRNCTLTQGFWKNHESAWPTSQLTLGTVTYDQSQLLAILHNPARGNGLVILAHQVIAAELSIAQGADLSDIEDTLAEAHALIGSSVVPPVGTSNAHPGSTSPLTQILDDFNNGVIGPGHCTPVSVEDTSWSRTKSAYR